ncbi:LysE family translocator [Bordetella tumulicola]|uniref:LysE family translocator n=1 Tax=Bordetella tumulicola TaxID=1649133 RepID=UPI0039EEA8C9
MEFVVPSTANLLLFTGSALVLLVIPGPAVLYIIAQSVEQGKKAGLVSDLGIHTATLVHVIAAALGLSALLASSALAFNLVKYAGAAYLIWLGLKKIYTRPTAAAANTSIPKRRLRALYRDGFIINLLNPKTALFFLAFLPQFTDPSQGHIASQILILGALLIVLGFISDACYAFAAGAVGQWLRTSRSYLNIDRYLGGAMLIGLGVVAALSGPHKK